MKWKTVKTIAVSSLLITVFLCAMSFAQAQEAKAAYPNMAPLDRYLMADRKAEIALARSAAPEAISRDAKILVLGRHGYETAVEGKNGFVCVVERSWMSRDAAAEFWNPKLRGPLCFNPPAVRSILPFTIKKTELILAGLSKTQVDARMKDALDKKVLPPLEPGAMSYMMSDGGYLKDSIGHWFSHLMIYVPRTDNATWGADLPGSPVLRNTQFDDSPEPVTIFMVRVRKWSDGTLVAYPSEHKH